MAFSSGGAGGNWPRCRKLRRSRRARIQVTGDAAMAEALTLPAWVSRRAGRLEPFEPDRICRGLFAALADLGRPDAFLARELTDGVLHFLAGEFDAPPAAAELAEFVAK